MKRAKVVGGVEAVLSDAEVTRAARAFALQWYGEADVLRPDCELADPPGTYYCMDYPDGCESTGDGGFFVSRIDGSIVALGSGDFTPNTPWLPTARETAVSPRVLRRAAVGRPLLSAGRQADNPSVHRRWSLMLAE